MEHKIRVALLIDSFHLSAWVKSLVSEVMAMPEVEVCLIVKNAAKPDRKPSGATSIRQMASQLMRRAYGYIDRAANPMATAIFKSSDCQAMLQGISVIEVTPERKGYVDLIDGPDVDAIKKHSPDVMLRFGFRIIRGEILNAARYGVWSYHHADNDRFRGGPPGMWEVIEAEPCTGAILQVLTPELDAGIVLEKGIYQTRPFSAARNKAWYYPRAATMLPRKLRELHRKGQALIDEAIARQANTYAPYPYPLYRASEITSSHILGLLWRWACAKATGLMTRALGKEQWRIYYGIDNAAPSPQTSFNKFKKLVPPKERFWADPFCIHDKTSGKYHIFFEDFYFDKLVGNIACVDVSAEGKVIGPPRTVLDRPYHMSYPFVFQWQDAYYMIPDTSSNRTVELYRATSFPERWELASTLMEGVRATDVTLHFDGQRHWMFACIDPTGVMALDELHLFMADSPFGPWQPHPQNPVVIDVRSARPAGKLFKVGQTLYRPSQDCSVHYGSQTNINRVVRLDAEGYEERRETCIVPRWDKGLKRTHTLNSDGAMTVLDATARRSRFW